MATLYPTGYATRMVTMPDLISTFHPKMHPEFSRRLFAWLESMGGQIGIGSGWRAIQPDKPGVAPEGKSFHQDQTFKSGFVGYAAVDLVARNPGGIHRAPTWAESKTGPLFGVHTFIKNPPEPWHMQCIEMRGWGSWVTAGRPDPPRWKPDPIPVPPDEEDDMKVILWQPKGYLNQFILVGADAMHATDVLKQQYGLTTTAPLIDPHEQARIGIMRKAGLTEAEMIKPQV